jgi:hypothetical protein
MAIGVREESGVRIVEGTPGASLMRRPQDATLVLEACFSALARVALLYPENLTPRFFDLSSGEAGEVLDKLRRFQVRLAIVCSPGTVQFSSRFREILSDDSSRLVRMRGFGWPSGRKRHRHVREQFNP